MACGVGNQGYGRLGALRYAIAARPRKLAARCGEKGTPGYTPAAVPGVVKNDKRTPIPGEPCTSHYCPLGVHNFLLPRLDVKQLAGKCNKKMQELQAHSCPFRAWRHSAS